MKIRLRFFFGCLCIVVWPLVSYAEPALEFLEQFPTGSINWTRGVVTARGNSSFQDINRLVGQDEKKDPAFQQAVQNLRQTLAQLRMNHSNRILDLLSAQTRIQVIIDEMTSAAKIVKTAQTPDGGVEVTLEMNFYGGFAQLMLPPDIRQVESIKPLNGSGAANYNSNQNQEAIKPDERSEPDAYSGLMVDARGIGARPSMVPVLVDENNQEVYGPNYVSREFAVHYGICQYIHGPVGSHDLPRVAPNPLLVKGLRAVSTGSCDIVISNSDASKLRSVSSHLEFLKQCRVVILID